jgi:uncharacterized protein
VKLLLVEEGSNEARSLWNADASLLTSWITFAEASAAIGASARSRRISRRRATDGLRTLHAEWRSVVALDVDEVTSRRAGELAMRYGLRGMDSIHLASAALLARAQPTLVTWDADLRAAALAEGLEVSGL